MSTLTDPTRYRSVLVVNPENEDQSMFLKTKPYIEGFKKADKQTRTSMVELVEGWLYRSRTKASIQRASINVQKLFMGLGERGENVLVLTVDDKELRGNDCIAYEKRELKSWERSVTKLGRLRDYLNQQLNQGLYAEVG